MLKIDLDDIDFVEGMNNYVAFHRGPQKTLAYLTMKELEDRLPNSQFMRVHKSYIVALRANLVDGEQRTNSQKTSKANTNWS